MVIRLSKIVKRQHVVQVFDVAVQEDLSKFQINSACKLRDLTQH